MNELVASDCPAVQPRHQKIGSACYQTCWWLQHMCVASACWRTQGDRQDHCWLSIVLLHALFRPPDSTANRYDVYACISVRRLRYVCFPTAGAGDDAIMNIDDRVLQEVQSLHTSGTSTPAAVAMALTARSL
jgi:hypothetical protein